MANRPASLSGRLEVRELTAVSLQRADWTRPLSESVALNPASAALRLVRVIYKAEAFGRAIR